MADPADAAPDERAGGLRRGAALECVLRSVGRFHVGHWQAEPGRRAVDYTESELCVLLEGRVRLTDAAGSAVEFGPGDAFVIAPGFTGAWESIGRVTKIYAVLEPG